MSLQSLLSRWHSDPSIGPNIVFEKKILGSLNPVLDFPPDLDPSIRNFLEDSGFQGLYPHQHQAWKLAAAGKNFGLISPTASGKTLAYTLPAANQLIKNKHSRALFLYPTKALAHDQLNQLRTFFPIPAAAYDGDTPSGHRPNIRNQARFIVSNPDMLHMGILPYHTKWAEFFANLKYVILDEIHVYRGVFGSHVANVLRRLDRILRFYGTNPQYFVSSATIGNPGDFIQKLIGQPLEIIEGNYQVQGEKYLVIYNPPIINPILGLRAGALNESRSLVNDLLRNNLQTLLFARSRRSVEHLLSDIRSKNPTISDQIQAYRSGYLPEQRRKIENDLKTGRGRAVIATNALELGIDIGGLDAVVLSGYPGTITSTWQQFGRSGRDDQPSLSVLVASSEPLDQFIAHHSEYLFSSEFEKAYIDPDNLLILLEHILCSSYELPFNSDETFGNLSQSTLNDFLDFLATRGDLLSSGNSYYWKKSDYPAGNISLRTASQQTIRLILKGAPPREAMIGTVDYESAFWLTHPGAVYLHLGDIFLVENLDLDSGTALLVKESPDYYTEAIRESSIEGLIPQKEIKTNFAHLSLVQLQLDSRVIGYKKISWDQYSILDKQPLDLPPQTLHTTGLMLTITENLEIHLQETGTWRSGPGVYGPDWDTLRAAVLKRDHHLCQVCGKQQNKSSLHVHHKQPLRGFSSYTEANHPDNLITLCPRCHKRAESVVKINSGLGSLGYTLHHLAPLLLMCDRQDLGVHIDLSLSEADNRPVLILYEIIPGGLGYSIQLFDLFPALLEMAVKLIQECPCSDGCPSCTGPGGELGSGGKGEALAMLDSIKEDLSRTG
jgi:DEAD/DEAH box helicase domain-containing protein